MNKVQNNVCYGCLSTDRRMVVVEDELSKQCFFQIISEISIICMSEEQLQLCWECERYIKKWVKFKEQVKKTYKAMQDFATDSCKKTQTSLIIRKLYQLAFAPELDEIDALQIKQENEINYKELLSNCNYVITDSNHLFIDSIQLKNETNTNDDKVLRVKQLLSNDLSPNSKEVYLNNESDVSDDILMQNDDVVSNNDNNVSNDPKYTTAIKFEDSDDELLVTLSRDYKKKRKEKNGLKEKKECLNGTASLKKRKSKKKPELYKEVRLSKEELKKERKIAESTEDYINAMFRCERCIVSFPNADDLADHVTLKHEMHASKHTCSVCECSFGSVVSYNYHRKRHRIRYECLVCGQRFITTRAALKHCELTHCLDPNVELHDADASANTETTGLNDGSVQSDRFPCESCEKTFKWKTSLRKHSETHRIENGLKRKPYCEPCRLSFSTTSNLQKHVKSSSNHQIQLKLIKLKESHSEDPPASKQARIDQIKTSVLKSTQRFRCPHCDRMFQWRGNLHRHMANHAARASGELVCKPCDRKFSSIETYNQHMRISRKHVSENVFKFVCDDCGKRFSDKIKLRDHVDWDHLKNYVHVCADCEKVFKSRTSLLLHSRAVHRKNGMDHLCDHCGKAFPNHGKLRSHIVALHMNMTPYKCGICPAKFNWQACLSRHVKKVHAQKGRKQEMPS